MKLTSLAGAVLAAAVTCVVAAAAPAGAATRQAAGGATTITYAEGWYSDATITQSVHCATHWRTAEVLRGLAHIEDAWMKMSTYYCWNGVPVGPDPRAKVTYHSTTLSVGITGPGHMQGWSWSGLASKSFNCYAAAGSAVNCSGNHEYAQEKFVACITKLGCYDSAYPAVDEWENYRGQFFSAAHNDHAP